MKMKLFLAYGVLAVMLAPVFIACEQPIDPDPNGPGNNGPSAITYTVAQTGGADGVTDSAAIVFTFSAAVDSLNLTAADITVSGKASKGTAALTGSGTSRTLPITVNAAGTATISINKTGIETATKSVTVFKQGQIAPETVTVTWHLNGGTAGIGAQHPTQIDKGEALAKPSPDPIKSGNIFDGWYTDSGLTQAYNFATAITANLDLYAKWVIPTPVSGSTLAAKLAWVLNEDNVQNGQIYSIEVSADEAIAPHTLSYASRSNISIILQGSGGEKIVSLSSNGSLFTVESGVTLVLDNNITLRGLNNNNASLITVNQSGKLIMNTGAKISDNTNTNVYTAGYASGGGVYIEEGIFTMTGGKISNNTVIGSVNGNGDVPLYGGGVFLKGTNTPGPNGGVFKGTFTMTGGEISDNTVNTTNDASAGIASAYGGGVCVLTGSFTMTGGKISNNTATASASKYDASVHGGGVYVFVNGSFMMTGGEISGNNINATAGRRIYSNGGGVCVDKETSFTKTGGTIYGYSVNDTINSNVVKNSSVVVSNNGHAVYVYVYGYLDDYSSDKRRETTAGPEINLDASRDGAEGGWEN